VAETYSLSRGGRFAIGRAGVRAYVVLVLRPIAPPLEGICELTLETSDRRRLEAFYTEVYGLRLLSRDVDRTWLACGPRTRLGLWDPGRKEFGDEGGRHVHFAFSAAPGALPALARRLETLGIRHRGPQEHDGGDRSIYVRDPAGNVVEVWDFFVRGRTVADLQSAERVGLQRTPSSLTAQTLA